MHVEGGDLVWRDGRIPLRGSCRALADAVGVAPRAPGNYPDGCGVDADEELTFDLEALAALEEWFGRGEAALRAFAPGVEPVLWPEHFDLGYTIDEVNYGVSPGDEGLPSPYAYVGPWTPRRGAFWNAPFGASRTAAELPDVDAVVAFFREGRAAAAP